MSTKMSNDLNITRPTSRVIHAPGGGSSISLGGDEPSFQGRHVQGGRDSIDFTDTSVPPPERAHRVHSDKGNSTLSLGTAGPKPPTTVEETAAEVAAEEETAADAAEEGEEKAEEESTGTVGIVIGGELATDALIAAITKALVKEGVTGSILAQVDDISIVPYAARNMMPSCDVVLVAAVLMDPSGTIAPALTASLMSLALAGDVPIIPAFIVQSSLLEAKALIPDKAAKSAKSCATMLALQSGGTVAVAAAPEPVIETPPVHTPELDDVNDLMAVLRESLKTHGARGIAGLSRKFKIIDDDGSGQIDITEFTKAIQEHALHWTVAQIQKVFDNFDTDKSKSISFDEFLLGVRGTLNDRRCQIVLQAFEILDNDKSGFVELNDIEAKYDASKHPDVISGKSSAEDVLREFLDTFDTMEKDGKVTPQEFCKYYCNVSASIDDDDYFELMLRNAWHISGGEGWCANSSCRRVAVQHTDGHQTVEEIKNDLGITAEDKDKMFENLLQQGIEDIEYIELTDGTRYAPEGFTPKAKPEDRPSTPPLTSTAAAMKEVVDAKDKTPPKVAGSPTKPKPDITQQPAPGANRRRAPGGASSIIFG